MYLFAMGSNKNLGKSDEDGLNRTIAQRKPKARVAKLAGVETLCQASRKNVPAKAVTSVHGAKHTICTGLNSAHGCVVFIFFLFTSQNTGRELFPEDLSSSHLNYSKVVFG